MPKLFRTVDYDVEHLILNNEYWFRASHIGENLEYVDPVKASRDCVQEKYRKKLCELIDTTACDKYRSNHMFISESGLLDWVSNSKQPKAKLFKEWIFDVAIPRLRQTIIRQARQHIHLQNETQLHYNVIAFTREFCPGILLCAGLGENQDSEEKRIDSWRKGYCSGEPDIQILNLHAKYSGMVCELKSPVSGGVLADNQKKLLRRYEQNNFKTLVSNDYNRVIVEILNYLAQTRIACLYCKRKFKTEESLERHVLFCHRKCEI